MKGENILRVNKSMWKIKDSDFGPLLPYVKNDNITDINYNGSAVWVDDLTKGRYQVDVKLSNDFVERFSTRIADTVSATFNQYNPLLEAETDTLRISVIHEEYANTGRSISIRKTPIIRRLSREKMLAEDYCTDEFLSFMEKCVAAKMNMLMCGLPGTGKTEFLKYLTSYIPPEERVITIEDNLEIHYADINPGKDCVELKVDAERFSYVTGIKACLRQNPQWILLSEARSTEVKYLLESMSTGTHCLTTIHTDDVRKVPDRIKNMIQDSVIASRIENDVFSFLDAAILIRKKMKNGKIYRYIDQMCVFSREENGENVTAMLVEDGKFVGHQLPEQIMKKFLQADIEDPFGDIPVEIYRPQPSVISTPTISKESAVQAPTLTEPAEAQEIREEEREGEQKEDETLDNEEMIAEPAEKDEDAEAQESETEDVAPAEELEQEDDVETANVEDIEEQVEVVSEENVTRETADEGTSDDIDETLTSVPEETPTEDTEPKPESVREDDLDAPVNGTADMDKAPQYLNLLKYEYEAHELDNLARQRRARARR